MVSTIGIGHPVLVNVVELRIVPGDQGSTLGELSGLQLQLGVVQTGDSDEMKDAEAWLGDDVENTIEDHLSVRGDHVGTIGKSPGNGL